MPEETATEEFVTLDVIAKALGKSKTTIYRWASRESNKIPHYQAMKNSPMRFKLSECLAWMKRG